MGKMRTVLKSLEPYIILILIIVAIFFVIGCFAFIWNVVNNSTTTTFQTVSFILVLTIGFFGALYCNSDKEK